MKTFEVTIDESKSEANLESVLLAIKGVTHVVLQSENGFLSDNDWIKPGRPASEKEIENAALEAENSTFTLPIEAARKLTKERFEAKWK